MLSEEDSKLGRTLAGGHIPSLAKAVMGHKCLREAVTLSFLDQLESECSKLCQNSTPPSLFCKVPVSEIEEFQWDRFIQELKEKAPLLLQILSSITSRNDHRNKLKTGGAHNPGICMAAAVILRERNQKMTGVQSLISMILFASHVDKQVHADTYTYSVYSTCTNYIAPHTKPPNHNTRHTSKGAGLIGYTGCLYPAGVCSTQPCWFVCELSYHP